MTKAKITVPELHIQLKNLCFTVVKLFWGFTRKTSRVHSRAFPEASPDRVQRPPLGKLAAWEAETHFPSPRSPDLPSRSRLGGSAALGGCGLGRSACPLCGQPVRRCFSSLARRGQASDWLGQKRAA